MAEITCLNFGGDTALSFGVSLVIFEDGIYCIVIMKQKMNVSISG